MYDLSRSDSQYFASEARARVNYSSCGECKDNKQDFQTFRKIKAPLVTWNRIYKPSEWT